MTSVPREDWPIDPGPSRWRLPGPDRVLQAGDFLGVGADLEPATLLAAYRGGMFPMPVDGATAPGWWSPDPRGVLPLDGLRVSRSLRRSVRRYEVTVDQRFADVVDACADPARPNGWITPEVREAYLRLHRMGWAHSFETWCDGELVGGLYGLAVDGLFAGESMFHNATDASKVALVALVDVLRADGRAGRLLDVQWATDHLSSLGVRAVPRPAYFELLATARTLPLPPAFATRPAR